MLDANTIAMWVPDCEVGGIPKYYRAGTSGYNVRRVLERVGGGNRLDKRWVLYWKNQRIWEVPSVSTVEGALEQAEDWLKEMDLIKVTAK